MKYVCTVCGYVYDDSVQAVPFDQLPDDWKCPLCGAPKSLFEPVEEETADAEDVKVEETKTAPREIVIDADHDDLVQLSPGELSALFSNLARGCEKQYQQEAMECFTEIAEYFENAVSEETDVDVEHLAKLIKADLDANYKDLIAKAKEVGDRGTLRITTWGEKVTKMAASLLDRYAREGDAFLENTGLYICTVCGFLYVGDNAPEICPVCKVPSWKFKKIDGREI